MTLCHQYSPKNWSRESKEWRCLKMYGRSHKRGHISSSVKINFTRIRAPLGGALYLLKRIEFIIKCQSLRSSTSNLLIFITITKVLQSSHSRATRVQQHPENSINQCLLETHLELINLNLLTEVLLSLRCREIAQYWKRMLLILEMHLRAIRKLDSMTLRQSLLSTTRKFQLSLGLEVSTAKLPRCCAIVL